MQIEQPTNIDAMEMLQGRLGTSVGPGELGVLLARAGVGKTACLTHIALEQLLRGQAVLHVCIDEIPEKVKIWYQEFLKNIVASQPSLDLTRLQQRIEPLRFILAYLHHTFSLEKLEQSLQNLKDQTKFVPSVVVLDGLDFDHAPRSTIEDLKGLVQKYQASLWMSARTHRHITEANEQGIPYPCHRIDDLLHTIVLLDPVPNAVRARVLKSGGRYPADQPVGLLNAQTFLLQPASEG